MKRFHIALSVADIARSVEDYTQRLGCPPARVVAGEYALWRTDSLNLSIRRAEHPGTLRHLGWEDSTAHNFTIETDVNGIVWEQFSSHEQDREIQATWPDSDSQ